MKYSMHFFRFQRRANFDSRTEFDLSTIGLRIPHIPRFKEPSAPDESDVTSSRKEPSAPDEPDVTSRREELGAPDLPDVTSRREEIGTADGITVDSRREELGASNLPDVTSRREDLDADNGAAELPPRTEQTRLFATDADIFNFLTDCGVDMMDYITMFMPQYIVRSDEPMEDLRSNASGQGLGAQVPRRNGADNKNNSELSPPPKAPLVSGAPSPMIKSSRLLRSQAAQPSFSGSHDQPRMVATDETPRQSLQAIQPPLLVSPGQPPTPVMPLTPRPQLQATPTGGPHGESAAPERQQSPALSMPTPEAESRQQEPGYERPRSTYTRNDFMKRVKSGVNLHQILFSFQ